MKDEFSFGRFNGKDFIALKKLDADFVAGEMCWVGSAGISPIAYLSYSPVPGLPQIGELHGFVAVKYRRQGIGSTLLKKIVEAAGNAGIHALSCPVSNLQSPPAHFLQKNNFKIEHEETQLEFRVVSSPLTIHHLPFTISPLPKPFAVPAFLKLYHAAFSPHPWYQPFTTVEATDKLTNPANLLFLFHQKQPIGFAWTQLKTSDSGQIEPLGIVPAFQNKKLSRPLLHAAINHLQKQGATTIHIGAWKRNKVALKLYESVGFKNAGSLIYLARQITTNKQKSIPKTK